MLMAPVLQQILQESRQGLEKIYGPCLADLFLFGSQPRARCEPRR